MNIMRRILLRVAYDGTEYCGFQVQPGKETVEGCLNAALTSLLGEKTEVIGASRTDSGVHALDSVVVFDTTARMPADKFSYAVNSYLPEDIRVVKSCEVSPDFHPRKRNSRKTYAYKIYCAPFSNPLLRKYSLFLYTKLDVRKMHEGAKHLIGEHDFKSFCSEGTQALTTVRTIYDASVTESINPDGSSMITLRITGNGFLYNMVRIIAGTLIEIGRGRKSPSDIDDILSACDRKCAGPTAEPQGLVLEKFVFDEPEE